MNSTESNIERDMHSFLFHTLERDCNVIGRFTVRLHGQLWKVSANLLIWFRNDVCFEDLRTGTNQPSRFWISSRAARSNCMSSQCFDFARRRGVAVRQISTASRARKPWKCDFVLSNWLPEARFIYFALFTYFHILASFRLSTLWPSNLRLRSSCKREEVRVYLRLFSYFHSAVTGSFGREFTLFIRRSCSVRLSKGLAVSGLRSWNSGHADARMPLSLEISHVFKSSRDSLVTSCFDSGDSLVASFVLFSWIWFLLARFFLDTTPYFIC